MARRFSKDFKLEAIKLVVEGKAWSTLTLLTIISAFVGGVGVILRKKSVHEKLG